jgi:hypothetical protein
LREGKQNILLLLIVLSLSSIIMSNGVLAIGITPGRTTLDFVPGHQEDIEFTVLNNEHKDMNVMLYVKEGSLSNLITLYDNIIVFRSDEDFKSFKYTIQMPDEMKEPGTHEIDIIAMDMPNTKQQGGAFVGATTAVVTQLLIRVPYPGKYATVDLDVPSTKSGEPVNFFVKVRNLGTESIEKAQATIDILGPTNEVIDRLETEEAGIGAKSWREFKVTWDAPVNPGIYFAEVTLRYDEGNNGGITTVKKEFAVGELFIDVTDITVKNFRLGGVAKFNIQTESKWNQKIENVHGNMLIEDQEGTSIADVKTASVDMEPLAREELAAYWETEGVKAGDYKGRFVLHYAGRRTEKELITHISPDDISIDILGLGIGAVTIDTTDSGLFTTDTITMLLLVILVVINMGWFMFFRRRRSSQ